MRRFWAAVAVVPALLALVGCTGTAAPKPSPTPTRTSQLAFPIPAHAKAYFFGDSWTAGYSAAPHQGFAYVTSTALGWTPTVDGLGGTGYLNPGVPGSGRTYAERASEIPDGTAANVVVLEGGLNDAKYGTTDLAAAASRTIAILQTKFPHADLIVFGPLSPASPADPRVLAVDAVLKRVTTADHLPYVSPSEQVWITSANLAAVIDPTTQHPSTAGHAYVGQRLAAAIRLLEAH